MTEPELSKATSIAEGRLHRYWPERNLTLFEYLPGPSATSRSDTIRPSTLIFIGGLSDGFLSVPYVPKLASYINLCPHWSLMEIQLSSSGLGWGTGDLHRDAEEIAHAVKYVRERSQSGPLKCGNVVLMGHSTGSQNVLHYLYHKIEQERPPIDGAILQAAVSDREGLAMMRERDPDFQRAYEECVRISLSSEAENPQGKIEMLPPELASVFGWSRGPVSCKRFLSLASPSSPGQPGLDDLFSSDLSNDTLRLTFGDVGHSAYMRPGKTPQSMLLVLLSAKDEYTPTTVDKKELIQRWADTLEAGGALMASQSGVIAGASHNVKEQKAQYDLLGRVLSYLGEIIGGTPEAVQRKLDEDHRKYVDHSP